MNNVLYQTERFQRKKQHCLLLESRLTRGFKYFTIGHILNEIDPLKQFQISSPKFLSYNTFKILNFDYLNFEQSILRSKLHPTTITRCHVILMMQTYQQSIQESNEDSPSSNPIQVLHHVLKNILRITTDERVSFSKWVEHVGYQYMHEPCDIFPLFMEYLYGCSDYIVDGQHCALEPSTHRKMSLFMIWLVNRTEGKISQISSQYSLSFTYQEFNEFYPENMIRMIKEQTSQTPSTTKPILSHISRSKPLSSLPHHVDLFDESACESAEENLLHLDEFKSSLSPPFQSSSCPPELPASTKTSTSNQPWGKIPERTDKIITEDPKKDKLVNPNPPPTICNPEPKPSFVLDTPHPQSQQLPSPDICSSPEKSSQDVDESHLSDSTSTTTNLNETFSLDTSCDHLLHLDSPSLSSELQDNSIIKNAETESVPDFEDLLQLDSTSVSSQDTSSIEIEFVSDPKEALESKKFSPTDVISIQHDYDLSLLNQEINTPSDNLHHQDTDVCEKQDQASSMQPT